MKPPNFRKKIRKCIGVINYYRNMWPWWSHVISPLTRLISIKRKIYWTQVEQDTFDKINRLVAHNNLLTYLYFNETFNIYTDASALQSGAVISQKGKHIALYGRKITGAQ